MSNVFISLPSTETVQEFVNTIAGMDGDFELINDIYILDARSLMGIFSLDLQKPIELRIYNDTHQNCEQLRRFIIRSDGKGVNNDGQ